MISENQEIINTNILRPFFSKNKSDLFKNIIKLPEVLCDEIYSYIPKKVTIFLNKQTYITEHNLIKNYIDPKKIEEYIRTIIRRDHNFIFGQLLVENYYRWVNMKDYYYKDRIFANYLLFLKTYAIDNESIKCQNTIKEIFEILGLNKNQHKKNLIKYIRWKA
jgi:hypothetical protein